MNDIGILLFSLLDYGLKEDEERPISPSLERLVELLVNYQIDDSLSNDHCIGRSDTGSTEAMEATLVCRNTRINTNASLPLLHHETVHDELSSILTVNLSVVI